MENVCRMITKISLPVNKAESFKNLAERAAQQYRIKAQAGKLFLSKKDEILR